MHNLDVHALVIGAGDQQEAPHRVGELAVVDLLFMLLLENPQEPCSLHIPNLRHRESGACLYLAATGSFHWREGGGDPTFTFLSLEQVASRRSSGEKAQHSTSSSCAWISVSLSPVVLLNTSVQNSYTAISMNKRFYTVACIKLT